MRLPRFQPLQPKSIEEAAEFLGKYGGRAEIMAGGTDLFPRIKYGVASPEVVITLRKLSRESQIVIQDGFLSIDSVTTLSQVVRSELVREHVPLLADAALAVGSHQIRNMGTLGGNLCLESRCTYYNQSHAFQFVEPCFKRGGEICYHVPKGKRCWAVFNGDTVPALMCLGAEVEIRTATDSRRVSIDQLYTGNSLRPLAISPMEIVSKILLPKPSERTRWAFAKFSLRGGLEFAGLSVAVLLEMMDDGLTCTGGRMVVGSVSSQPLRAKKAEKALSGKKLSNDLFYEIAETISEDVKPFSHHGYSASYLKKCLKIQVKDALALASQRVPQSPMNPREL